jgi:hypothetical protein
MRSQENPADIVILIGPGNLFGSMALVSQECGQTFRLLENF